MTHHGFAQEPAVNPFLPLTIFIIMLALLPNHTDQMRTIHPMPRGAFVSKKSFPIIQIAHPHRSVGGADNSMYSAG